MKHLISMIMALSLLIFPVTNAETVGSGLDMPENTSSQIEYIPGADWYLDTALELAAEIGVLATDEAYLSLFVGNIRDEIDVISQYDFTAPEAGYRLEGYSFESMKADYMWLYDSMTDAGLEALIRMAIRYAVYIDQPEPYESMAIYSEITRCVPAPEDFQPQMILLDYGGLYVMAQYAQLDPGLVDIRAAFALNGKNVLDTVIEIRSGSSYKAHKQIY